MIDVIIEKASDMDDGTVPSPAVVDKDSELEPHDGVEFDSHEAVYSFYQEYAKTMGLTTSVKNSRRWLPMSTRAKNRLMRDFKRLQQDPLAGINSAPQDNHIMIWNAVISGPDVILIGMEVNVGIYQFTELPWLGGGGIVIGVNYAIMKALGLSPWGCWLLLRSRLWKISESRGYQKTTVKVLQESFKGYILFKSMCFSPEEKWSKNLYIASICYGRTVC